jgi:predicted  nucleic acid-binding Zn-ribbon protein
VSNDLKELTQNKEAIRKRLAQLREELAPLAAKTDALREQISFLELDFSSALDALREATK